MTKLLFIFIALSSTISPQEISLGILHHDVGYIWGNKVKESGADLNLEVLLGSGLIRPNVGLNLNSSGDTSKIYAGYVISSGSRAFISFALGAAIHSGKIHSQDSKSLGSRFLFRIALEVGVMFGNYGVSLILDHISNADLARYNDGLDVLGIRFKWRIN